MAAWLLNLDAPPSGDTAATPDGLALNLDADAPNADSVTVAGPDEGPTLDVVGDAPAADNSTQATPDGLAVDVLADNPTIVVDDTAATPDGLAVTLVGDNPGAGEIDYTEPSDDVTLTAVGDNPTLTFAMAGAPDSGQIDITADQPSVAFTAAATPDGAALDLLTDQPSVSPLAAPDGLAVTLTADQPSAAWNTTVTPDSLTITVLPTPPANVGAPPATPDGLAVDVTVGDGPSITWAGVITPGTVYVELAIDPASLTFVGPPDYRDPPLTATMDFERRPLPLYMLGVGPRNSVVTWRGAPNHGVTGGAVARPAVPAMMLPQAGGKSYTLRLNAGSEARTDHVLARADALIIEEMLTDLWWYRRDPTRGVVEGVNRFNAAKVDISSTGGALTLSCTWEDYRSLLEDRMVLAYYDVVHQESQWPTNTLVTDILRFAVPTNTGIDLTAIQPGTATAIGTIKSPFELEPGTTVGEVFDNLLAISNTPWEWWVDMADLLHDQPVLRLIAGIRGRDAGIYLTDVDGVHGPISSWTVQAASDKYANAVFYSGSKGGFVEVLDDQIALYGQRDTRITDSSLLGDENMIRAAAVKKLAELAAKLPTFTVTLRPGYWQGRGHIDVGDWVNVRVMLGRDLISGKQRVSEIGVDIDASGAETVTLTLGTPRPAKDPRSRLSATARLVRSLKAFTPKGPPA